MKYLFNCLIVIVLLMSCGKDEPVIPKEEPPYEWVATHSIEDFLAAYDGTEVSIDTIAIVGTVISSDESTNITNELFIRDKTSALKLLLEGDNLYQDYPVGSEVLVKCVGLEPNQTLRTLSFPSDMPIELTGNQDKFLLTGETSTVVPSTVTLSRIGDEYLNDFIRFGGYQFTEDAVGQTYVQNNSETIRLMYNTSGDTVYILFRPSATFANEAIPEKAGLVQGIFIKHQEEYAILINELDDLDYSNARKAPFVKETFEFGNNTLPYQIMFPRGYSTNEEYPLVVFLHGAGERGTNNTSQMAYGTGTFGSYDARTNYPAIVIYPQCPPDVMWSRREKYTNDDGVLIFEFPVEDEPNYAMEMVIELVRELIQTEAVDTSRIYITGLSMGGIGTLEFMYYAPDLAAAGISMAGGHDSTLVSSYASDISFRLYHGADDTVVPERYSQQVYDAMVSIGASVEYFKAEGRGHEWNYVLNDPDYIAWMFAQSKE